MACASSRRPSSRSIAARSRTSTSSRARPSGVTLSPAADRADVVQAGINQIFVDQYTGRVLGHRTVAEWNKTLPRRLHVLHVTLMSGKIGGEIMAIATIVSLVLVLSGI